MRMFARCCRPHRIPIYAALWLAFGTSGCSGPAAPATSDADVERFVPSSDQAVSALRSVLEAWRQGTPPGMIPDTSPPVYVTDTRRNSPETLVEYRILGEVPSDKKRCYAVELRFAPERAERTRFLVVGIDPLWVFRLEDAENLAHWEHNSDSRDAPGKVPTAAESETDAASEVNPQPPLKAETQP